MTTKQLYHQLNLMPILQTHMLRVAGVAQIISNSWKNDQLNPELAVKACLLHDLGNIAKFKLDNQLAGITPLTADEKEYWKAVQKGFWAKYGTNAHQATLLMCKEIGALAVMPIINEELTLYDSSPTPAMLSQALSETIVLMYADMRVMPHGVVPYQDRINDLCTRYNKPLQSLTWSHDLESFVQSQTSVNLADITESSVIPLFDSLLEIHI